MPSLCLCVYKHAYEFDSKFLVVQVYEWLVSFDGLVTCPGCIPTSHPVTAGINSSESGIFFFFLKLIQSTNYICIHKHFEWNDQTLKFYFKFVEETAGPLHHPHSEMCFNPKNLTDTSMFM